MILFIAATLMFSLATTVRIQSYRIIPVRSRLQGIV